MKFTSRKGQATTTTLIIIALIVVLGVGAYLIYHRNSENGEYGNNNGNNNNNNQTGWNSFTWGPMTFQYPSDWKLYATVGATSTAKNATDISAIPTNQITSITVYKDTTSTLDVISLGGKNVTCAGFSKTVNCATFYGVPVYTKSANSDVQSVYGQLLTTIVKANKDADAFAVTSPVHLDSWNGGESHTITWNTSNDVSSTKATINIWNASTSKIAFVVTANATSGSANFSVPNTKAASSTFYFLEIVSTGKVSATSTKTWTGWSDPFYIQASGPVKNATSTTSNTTSTLPQVVVTKPLRNAKIASPLAISGKAMNPWYFEAVFPIQLLSATGSVIAQTQGHATTDWTKTGVYIPFTASMTFPKQATGTTGSLVFMNDNPSGDPSKQITFTVPVKF